MTNESAAVVYDHASGEREARTEYSGFYLILLFLSKREELSMRKATVPSQAENSYRQAWCATTRRKKERDCEPKMLKENDPI